MITLIEALGYMVLGFGIVFLALLFWAGLCLITLFLVERWLIRQDRRTKS